MKNILVIGTGLSSRTLIRYLLDNAAQEQWMVQVVDQNKEVAEKIIEGKKHARAHALDVKDDEQRQSFIKNADLVISMVPASMHPIVAKDCIAFKKNMITPSYVSKEMRDLNDEAREAGILILNELGVDPGIDHMSAMKVINGIREEGGKMHIFESFAGGLVAPESDNNPWNYKITWNPKNVVLAGQGSAAKFIQEGQYKYIPYKKLFRRTELIEVGDLGVFEGYANRDSLKYRSVYGLDNIPTIYRGTLRKKGFSRAWDVFVQLGATDDTYEMENTENMTYRDFINAFLPWNPNDSVELKLRHYLHIELDDTLWDKLVWLGIFEKRPIGLKNATPAQILQQLISEKWKLEPHDKDMIVMWHKFVYKKEGEFHEINASMAVTGEDQTYTAMSNTVGYPLGIAAKMVLNETIKDQGVHIPIQPHIYNPILDELKKFGIDFEERVIDPPKLYEPDATGV